MSWSSSSVSPRRPRHSRRLVVVVVGFVVVAFCERINLSSETTTQSSSSSSSSTASKSTPPNVPFRHVFLEPLLLLHEKWLLRLFSDGGGRDDDDAWRCVVFRNATPKEEEEEKEEEKDIFARVVSIFPQKFLTSKRKKRQRRKRRKKRETLLLGFRVYLEKEKKGDSATLSSKNKKILQILFARTTRTDTSTPPSSTKPALNGIVSRTFVAFVRVEREKRRSRGSRRLPFSLVLSFFERRFATSRQRWSVSPSRAFVPGEGVRGRRTRRKRARTAGIETNRYRTTRFCASEARSTVASFRSGTRFSRPLSRKIVTAKGNSSTRKKWEGGKNCRAEKTRRRVDATTSTRRFERSRARR